MSKYMADAPAVALLTLLVLVTGLLFSPIQESQASPGAVSVQVLPLTYELPRDVWITWRVDGASTFGHNNVHYGPEPCPDISCYPFGTANQPGGSGQYTALIQEAPQPLYFRVHASAGASSAAVTEEYIAELPFDRTFGYGGWVWTVFGTDYTYTEITDLAAQPDGKIVAAGFGTVVGSPAFLLVRYNSDGTLDTSFGDDGKVITYFAGKSIGGSALGLQPDGKIVVVGYSHVAPTLPSITLFRYNGDGSLDSTFGSDGTVVTSLNGSVYPLYVALQPEGKILVAGILDQGSAGSRFVFARYHSNGSLDPRFGNAGISVTDVTPGYLTPRYFLLADGKLLVVGDFSGFGFDVQSFALVRYDSDGSLDTTFGENGRITVRTDGSMGAIVGVVFPPDGKTIVIGITDTEEIRVGRYNSDGSLDTTFGNGGITSTSIMMRFFWVSDIALQADGKIIVLGSTRLADDYSDDFAVVKLNRDGTLDTTFFGGLFAAGPVGSLEWSSTLILQADCRIVAGGRIEATPSTGADFFLMRFPNPILGCTDFDGSGQVTVDDIQAVAGHWNQRWGDPGWDDRFDLDHNWRVDMLDIMRVAAAWESSSW